jgi:hypothetical protein
MSIKDDIERTYNDFNAVFLKETGESLNNFQMSQVRDQFKQWIDQGSPIFRDMIHAEDAFLYIYHFTELQEIKKKVDLFKRIKRSFILPTVYPRVL